MKKKIEKKTIVGLEIRTTNEEMKAVKDLGMIWQKFMELNLVEKLGDSVVNPGVIYGVYFDYEKDYTKPYSFIAGVEVKAGSELPANLSMIEIPATEYNVFETIDGDLHERVGEAWNRVWNSDIKRSYKYDLEIYDYRTGAEPKIEVLIG